MWLNAPCGPEQVAGSLTRTFTIAAAFAAFDAVLLLLQLFKKNVEIKIRKASVQKNAVLRIGQNLRLFGRWSCKTRGHWDSPRNSVCTLCAVIYPRDVRN